MFPQRLAERMQERTGREWQRIDAIEAQAMEQTRSRWNHAFAEVESSLNSA